MGRNAISALALLLCTLMIGAMDLAREMQARAGGWESRMPAVPFRSLNEGNTGIGRSSVHASLRPA